MSVQKPLLTDHCPMMEYIRGLGPVGSMVQIDLDRVWVHLKLRNREVAVAELKELQNGGLIRYASDPVNTWSVRIVA
jgi:hypothetical protein